MPYIDYAAVRKVVSMRDVLAALYWSPRYTVGAQWRGYCPVDGHKGSASRHLDRVFSVNIDSGLYRCFKCVQKEIDYGGNQLDLYARARRMPLYAATLEILAALSIPVPARAPGRPKTPGTGKRNQ